MVFLFEILSQTLDSEDFVATRRSSLHVVNKANWQSSLVTTFVTVDAPCYIHSRAQFATRPSIVTGHTLRESDTRSVRVSSVFLSQSYEARKHTHTRLTALCPVLPGWAGTSKVKPIWILLRQETVNGSGISWAICKSAPRSRQITTPVPHHSVFTGRMPFLLPNQQRQSTEGKKTLL